MYTIVRALLHANVHLLYTLVLALLPANVHFFYTVVLTLQHANVHHLYTLVLALLHTNVHDKDRAHSDAIEDELVSKWKEIGLKLSQGDRISIRDWDELSDKLRHQGVEIIHCQRGQSIKIWVWCRSHVAIIRLQKMIQDGRLRNALVRFFNLLLKREGSLMVDLTVKSQQFLPGEPPARAGVRLLAY